jgi:hypothetical protein
MKINLIQPKADVVQKNDSVQSGDQLAELLVREQELISALDAYKEINDINKIELFESKLKILQSKISDINQHTISLSNQVIISEERAGIIENSKVERIESEIIAYKEIQTKTIDPEKSKFWIRIFDFNEVLNEAELVGRLIKENGLVMNKANVTMKINEIFSAEYEGYISNTSEIVASNHQYKVAQ